jgi:7-carboxy-7-deazaguanine synthase
MRIAETFYSVQGEGKLTGVPSLFIRVSGCNLRCAWCDTPYASWRPEGGEQSVDDLVRAAADAGARHVVLTGGEPLLFEESCTLSAHLRQVGHHVTVETAGTLFRPIHCDLLSISPKLANSTPAGEPEARHEAARRNLEPLRQLMALPCEKQLKFVVNRQQDLDEIQSILQQISGWMKQDILLMPEGTTPSALAAHEPWVVEICKREGYRYCPRLHVQLWGNRRGV